MESGGERGGRVLPVLLAVLAVLAVATTVVLLLDRRDPDEALPSRPVDVGVHGWAQTAAGQPVALAQRAARAYVGLDVETVAALGTEAFARAYERDAAATLDRIRGRGIELTGRVVRGGTATEELDAARAQVLVSLDVVTTRSGQAGPAQPYRLRVVVRQIDDEWRVAQLQEVR